MNFVGQSSLSCNIPLFRISSLSTYLLMPIRHPAIACLPSKYSCSIVFQYTRYKYTVLKVQPMNFYSTGKVKFHVWHHSRHLCLIVARYIENLNLWQFLKLQNIFIRQTRKNASYSAKFLLHVCDKLRCQKASTLANIYVTLTIFSLRRISQLPAAST